MFANTLVFDLQLLLQIEKLDEKLKDLSTITVQVTKGTSEQVTAMESTTAMTDDLSKSINNVVRNAEQL